MSVPDEEARILDRLAAGPLATREVARLVVDSVGPSARPLVPDLAPLHALWRAGRIRWDWLEEKWRLPHAWEVAS